MTVPETESLAPHVARMAHELALAPTKVAAALELFDAGNTLPFIARYRKEATGGLDEEQLRAIQTRVEVLRALDERRATIMAVIEQQGKLTDDLRAQLLAAETLTTLEDLYLPYKPKRRTRASIARERGLQGLADLILQQPRTRQTLDQLAAPFITPAVPTADDAWAGARDIVAEQISDHAEVRQRTREKALQWGQLTAEKVPDAEDARRVYETYYTFNFRCDRVRPHQVLALNRGEREEVLRVRVAVDPRDWQKAMLAAFPVDSRSALAEVLTEAMADCAQRLLLPAIERDVRAALTVQAETHAIGVFAANLRALLSQPPLAGQTVLGIDPGFRTGCKVCVVDPTGKLLAKATIFPHEPQKQMAAALNTLTGFVTRHAVTLVAIGNGTASRETERLVAELVRQVPSLRYLIVNEAGASVYSASVLARAEMPELDVSERGAVSIARRAQDPLAELVKIDPQSIGVGLYQHDVDQPRLADALDGVVESVVNRVGVDVNTASPALLQHVAGIGPKLAERIVAERDAHGPFHTRAALRNVSGLGPKTFEQCAGFLRIRDGTEPLDTSAIHPESYAVARAVLKRAGCTLATPREVRASALGALQAAAGLAPLAEALECGTPTLVDIFEQLVRPGRDPREDLSPPLLRSDVLAMEDLRTGMRLYGTVRNVVDFGAFIDIGVKQDGLLHRSQQTPGMALNVGDVLEVEVVQIELERGRIALKPIT